MVENYTYKKESDHGTKWYSGVIQTANATMINPSEEVLLSEGWKKHPICPPALYSGSDEIKPEVFIAQLYSTFPDLRHILFPVIDGTIFHYTTWSVLFQGILNEKNQDSNGERCVVLRAYSVNYMNDDSEGLLFAQGIADSERESVQEHYPQEKLDNPLLLRRYKMWGENAKSFRQNRFSISFSHESDSLPMWNYYGYEGKGICIGFDVKEIWNQGFCIFDCIYDAQQIQSLAQFAYKNIDKYPRFIDVLPKDGHFEYEKECRISLNTIIPRNYVKNERDIFYPVKYGLKNGYIVPYIDLFLPLSSINEIVIGPTLNLQRAQDSLHGWLNSLDLKNIKVKSSRAPLAR